VCVCLRVCVCCISCLSLFLLIERLPQKMRRIVARDYCTESWSLPELRKAIYREMDIIHADEIPQKCETIPTASFFTGARKKPQRDLFSRQCVCCEKQHGSDCKQVMTLSNVFLL